MYAMLQMYNLTRSRADLLVFVLAGQCVTLTDCSAVGILARQLPEALSSALLTSAHCSIMSLREERYSPISLQTNIMRQVDNSHRRRYINSAALYVIQHSVWHEQWPVAPGVLSPSIQRVMYKLSRCTFTGCWWSGSGDHSGCAQEATSSTHQLPNP